MVRPLYQLCKMDEDLFYLTADQLTELQALVWGARMTNASEPKRYADLIKQIETQLVELLELAEEINADEPALKRVQKVMRK
jgi:hypothetical protein